MFTSEKGLDVSYKTKDTCSLGSSNSTLRCLPRRNDNICPQKSSPKNVHSSLISNSHKLEAAQVPINKKMDKQIVVFIQRNTTW